MHIFSEKHAVRGGSSTCIGDIVMTVLDYQKATLLERWYFPLMGDIARYLYSINNFHWTIPNLFIELDDGKIYRNPLYLTVKTMVSCRFSLKPIPTKVCWFCADPDFCYIPILTSLSQLSNSFHLIRETFFTHHISNYIVITITNSSLSRIIVTFIY